MIRKLHLSIFKKTSFKQSINLFKYFSTTKMLANDEVLTERVNNVGLITLNRPKQLNAINLEMVRQIYKQIKSWENDSNVHLILIKNNKNSNAFCAGGDVKAMREAAISGNIKKGLEFFNEEYLLNYSISACTKPYIAFINGITMGGGVGLSIHGRYRVATEKTLFAMPETAIGFFPDIGAAYPLSRLEGNLGVYLALTGARLRGKDVYDTGIATHFLNSSKADEFEDSLRKLNKPNLTDIEGVLNKFNTETRSKYPMDKINSIFSGNSVEKIYENLENDKSEWSNKQLSLLNKMSPTALKVTFEQFRLAKSLTLKQVLDLDYQLSHRFMKHNDFPEGVRALLVDKDNKPNWIPKKVNEVTSDQVDWFFKPQNSDEKFIVDVQSKI